MDFRERYGPWAIIAGASEAVGRSFALKIAAQGVSCILVANAGPLDEVAAEVRAATGVDCIAAVIDLALPDAVDRMLAVAGDREIGLYVANAGGDPSASRFLARDHDGWARLLQLNVATTMRACHVFGAMMRRRGHGGLLVVNSGAAYGGGVLLAVYSGAKAFLLNFCESLWAELKPDGVDVLTVTLGRTDTPNLRRLQARLGQPMPTDAAAPDAVAQAALDRLAHGPVHNFGCADDRPYNGNASADDRRRHVEATSAGMRRMYGLDPSA